MFDERIGKLFKQGRFIHYSETPPEDSDRPNIFCGEHSIKGAQCPNCNYDLQRYFSIDLDRPPFNEEAPGLGYIHFLYCWRCALKMGHFVYKIVSDTEIKITEFVKGKEERNFPYKKYPNYFPQGSITFHDLSKDLQKAIHYTNNYDDGWIYMEENYSEFAEPHYQIGGEPYLLQPIEIVHCTECGKMMPFVLAAANDCLDTRGFLGMDISVLFHLCPSCKVVGCYHHCD